MLCGEYLSAQTRVLGKGANSNIWRVEDPVFRPPPRSNIIVYPPLEGAAQMKANSPGSGHLFNDSTLPLGSVDQDLGLS